MDDYIYLTTYQEKWLKGRGGRNRSDVRLDENGKLYILMGDGKRGWMKVYLPK